MNLEQLAGVFAVGLVAKARAIRELDMTAPQAAAIRGSMAMDIRKYSDLAFPELRPYRVSVAAAEVAAGLGADLTTLTWARQPKVDKGRVLLHYEHTATLGGIIAAICAEPDHDLTTALLVEGVSVAWITKEEDRLLTELGFRTERPDPVAAYSAAGIQLLPDH